MTTAFRVMTNVIPEAIGTATFARASTATYWNWDYTLQTAAINVLRENWDPYTTVYQGVLIEPAATNLILNSATLVTQSCTVVNGSYYTFSGYSNGGASSVAISFNGGGVTTYTLALTGLTQLFSIGFTATSSGTVKFTVSGIGVRYAQLELGAAATSRIVTAGSPVTRAADVITGTGIFYTDFVDATAAYAAGTTYYTNDVVQYGSSIYKSIYATNHTGHQPDTSPTYWAKTKANNITAMFDNQSNTQSVGSATPQKVFVKLPSVANAIALLNVDATQINICVSDGYSAFTAGGYSTGARTIELHGTALGTIVTLYAAKTASVPSIGKLCAGLTNDIGSTQYGLTTQLIDYSKKTVDDFGLVTFVPRSYSKRMTAQVIVAKSAYNTVFELIATLRETPAVWIAVDDPELASGAYIYGFLRDMRTVIPYPEQTLFSIEIEGLT